MDTELIWDGTVMCDVTLRLDTSCNVTDITIGNAVMRQSRFDYGPTTSLNYYDVTVQPLGHVTITRDDTRVMSQRNLCVALNPCTVHCDVTTRAA